MPFKEDNIVQYALILFLQPCRVGRAMYSKPHLFFFFNIKDAGIEFVICIKSELFKLGKSFPNGCTCDVNGFCCVSHSLIDKRPLNKHS